MRCSRVQSMLEAYYEGTLSPRREQEVADHVVGCASCAAQLSQIERVATALSAVPRALPDVDLLGAILERVAELPQRSARRTWSGWRTIAGLAAASMVLLALVGYAVPLVMSAGLAADRPLLRWVAESIISLRQWFGAAPGLLVGCWYELVSVVHGLGLALRTAAPLIGGYIAAEIGILAALVFVFHTSRRRASERRMLLI